HEPDGNRADLHLVAPVLPSRRETLAELEAGVALVEPAGLDHLLDAKEQALEVDADERRGNHAEDRERRVAAADRRLAGEDGAEAPLASELLERRARVGDGRKGLAAAARPLPEEVEVTARLESRPGLRGDDEERAGGIEPVRAPAYRRGMGCVEHLEELALEAAPQHLGGAARAPHAEQDDGVEVPGDAGREPLQLLHPLAHAQRLLEPTEPAVLVAPGPERRIAGPEALDQLGGRERGQGLGCDELARL